MRSEFDLNTLPARERYDYWRHVSQSLHVPVAVSCDRPDAFSARYDGRYLGRFAAGSAFISVEHSVSRTLTHIRQSSDDMVGVWMPLSGGMLMHQDGRDAHIRPGQLGVVDPSRPYKEFSFDDFNFLWIQLPRAEVESKIGSTRAITGIAYTVEEPHARLAIEYLRSLSEVWDSITGAQAEQAASHACTLLALAFNRRQPSMLCADSGEPDIQMLRIRFFVKEHLSDSDLTSEVAGRALNMAATELERLMLLHGEEFERYVLNRRLSRCARMLADSHYGAQSAADIAHINGLQDVSGFRRAFTERYSMSPDDYRVERWSGENGANPNG